MNKTVNLGSLTSKEYDLLQKQTGKNHDKMLGILNKKYVGKEPLNANERKFLSRRRKAEEYEEVTIQVPKVLADLAREIRADPRCHDPCDSLQEFHFQAFRLGVIFGGFIGFKDSVLRKVKKGVFEIKPLTGEDDA